MVDLSLVYFPSAVVLGALHALEPGHAKTLTAAYLIGIKGTKRDAVLLGLSVATTHSLVVVGLSVCAVMLGREAFTDEATHFLAIGSGVVVIVLGAWLLFRRLRMLRRASKLIGHHHHHSLTPVRSAVLSVEHLGKVEATSLHLHEPDHHHDHALLSDEEHARAHAATLPAYIKEGERPTIWQIMAFGAAGGLVPCPAAISVMLLSLSLSQSGKGLIIVLGFSIGLALTLVGLGLIIVSGIHKIVSVGKLSRFSAYAPALAALMVIFSGFIGILVSVSKGH